MQIRLTTQAAPFRFLRQQSNPLLRLIYLDEARRNRGEYRQAARTPHITSYGHAAPAYVVASALWWPGCYDYAPSQWGVGVPTGAPCMNSVRR